MNADTLRKIEETNRNRFYWSNTTLGDGGWQAIYGTVAAWKTYLLLGDEPEPISSVRAENDATAVDAFSGVFRMEGLRIVEKTVSYRKVK